MMMRSGAAGIKHRPFEAGGKGKDAPWHDGQAGERGVEGRLVRDGHIEAEVGVGAGGVADPLGQAARGGGEAVAVGDGDGGVGRGFQYVCG